MKRGVRGERCLLAVRVKEGDRAAGEEEGSWDPGRGREGEWVALKGTGSMDLQEIKSGKWTLFWGLRDREKSVEGETSTQWAAAQYEGNLGTTR